MSFSRETQRRLQQERVIVDRLNQSFERRYARRLAKLQNRFIEQATKLYNEYGIVSLPTLTEDYEQNLQSIVNDLAGRVIPKFNERTTLQLGALAASVDEINSVGFKQFLVEDYANTFALKRSKLITDTSIEQLKMVVKRGISENLTNKEIAKNLLKVKKLTPNRAKMVAQTEVHNANQFANIKTIGKIQEETQADIKKAWVANPDNRVREDHRAMNNKSPVPFNQPFDVGGELLDYPGDPNGSPGNVINCRCTVVPIY